MLGCLNLIVVQRPWSLDVSDESQVFFENSFRVCIGVRWRTGVDRFGRDHIGVGARWWIFRHFILSELGRELKKFPGIQHYACRYEVSIDFSLLCDLFEFSGELLCHVCPVTGTNYPC